MKIIPLSEGAFTVDQSKEFIPFNIDNDDLKQRSRGSLLVEIQPFLVITSSDLLLMDTGLGFTDDDGKMRVHQLLSQHGFQASDITKVLLTHLHKDHSGGVMLPGKKEPAFENATYYINEDEWKTGLGASSSYHPEDYQHLKDVEFTKGTGWIDGYIQYIHTGGHSPYHQAFKIEDGGEVVFFGGDVASQFQQIKTRFKAKYDYEPVVAMEWRQQWKEQGEKEGWTFLFYHDIKYPAHKI